MSGDHGVYPGIRGCKCVDCRRCRREYVRARRARGADTWVNATFGSCVRSLGWPRAHNGDSVKLESE